MKKVWEETEQALLLDHTTPKPATNAPHPEGLINENIFTVQISPRKSGVALSANLSPPK